VAINFVTEEDVRTLRELEQFYNTKVCVCVCVWVDTYPLAHANT